MPAVIYELPDIEQTVSRQTAYGVIEQLKEIIGLPQEVQVTFTGKREVSKLGGSAIDGEGLKTQFSATGHRLMLTVIEEDDFASVQEIQPMSFDQRPVFEDPNIDFSLRPVYKRSKVELQITFRHTSETEVRRWAGRILSSTAQGRDTYLHDMVYTYPVPKEFLMMAYDIHRLREAQDGYGDTLTQYLKKCQIGMLTTIVARDGCDPILAVKEKQSQVIGNFSFTVAPDKPTHLPELGIWETTFSYFYQYERPDAACIRFPVAVHNQPLPEIWLRHLDSPVDYQARNTYQSRSYTALNYFSHDAKLARCHRPNPYIRYPEFDDFGEGSGLADTVFDQDTGTIMVLLSYLDTDKKSLLSLHELGPYMIDEDVLAFLSFESPHLANLYHSVYHISVYKNGVRMLDDQVEVTPELMVKCKSPQSYRDQFHVRFSAIPNITKPLYQSLMRLKGFPKAFFKTVKLMNELLAIDPDLELWEKGNKVESWMFSGIYRVLTATHQGNLFSPDTNLPHYGTGPGFTERPYWGLLENIPKEVIDDYLRRKRVIRFVEMDAYVIARRIENMDTPLPTP